MVASNSLTFALTAPVSPESLRDLRAAASSALAAGAGELVLDLDHLTTLEASAISTLIVILREARDRGAGVRLVAGRPSVLATLRVTGLDKVFVVEAGAGAARPEAGSSGRFPGKRPHGMSLLGAA